MALVCRHGDELLHGLGRAGLQGVVVEVPSGRHHHGQRHDEEDRPRPVTASARALDRREGSRSGAVDGQPRDGGRGIGVDRGGADRIGGRAGAVGHQRHVVGVVGHSGGVVAPEPAGPSADHEESGAAVMKPAMEPPDSVVTEPPDSRVTEPPDSRVTDRRRDVALAGHQGDEAGARSGLTDPAPSVRATALGALDRIGTLTDDELRVALADPAPSVRRRASELAATRRAVRHRRPPRRPGRLGGGDGGVVVGRAGGTVSGGCPGGAGPERFGPSRPPLPRGGGGRARGHRRPGRPPRRPRRPRRQAGRASPGRRGAGRLRGTGGRRGASTVV